MNVFQQQLKSLEGRPITLGNELGRGGEGAIFPIEKAPNLIVKIYHQIPAKDKVEKILAMVRLRNDRLLNLSAWPLAPFYSEKGHLAGYIMTRLVNHCPIYELYNPKIRLEKFPKADWRFLVHAATNVARAFAVMHDSNHVVGDVNHGNLLVAQDATVRFIDTDSFQIIDNNKCWFCEVGVSTHQPPEMQAQATFNGLLRTPNHDNFGLAVLIFQLLFLARHPFSGIFQGHGEMPIEKAIKEYRFAFSSQQKAHQMQPPPASLSMDALTPHLRLLFERAFSRDGTGTKVGLRPAPDEWITALTSLAATLTPCSSKGGHYYFKEHKACPWCDIESQSGLLLFPTINLIDSSKADFATIWQQVLSIKDPGTEPQLPPLNPRHVPVSLKGKEVKNKLKSQKKCCFIIWLILVLITIFLGYSKVTWTSLGVIVSMLYPIGATMYYDRFKRLITKDIVTEINTIKQNWEDLIAHWNVYSSGSSFTKLRQKIDNLKSVYEAIGTSNDQHNQQIDIPSYQAQLKLYLKSFSIEKANIQGIGTERVSTLRLHGIETAADVEEKLLYGIKGLGGVIRKRLISWRQQVEKSFVFNSKNGLGDIANRKKHTIAELANATSQLTNFIQQVHQRRQFMANKATDLLTRYSQAVADAQTIDLEF